MVQDKKTCFSSETYHEGENKIIRISAENCSFPPSIEYSKVCMSKVIDLLLENSGVTIIIISQNREYEYDFYQTTLLNELALVYKKLNKEERHFYNQLILNPQHERYIRGSQTKLQNLVATKLKEDPLAAYIELKRMET